MSLQTWKDEYCPITAHEAAKQGMEAATRHSLKKWEGLRNPNLAKHGLVHRAGSYITDGTGGLSISACTCALCQLYDDSKGCPQCPLAIVRGGVRCDRNKLAEERGPYQSFTVIGNPEPMIRDLSLALAHITED